MSKVIERLDRKKMSAETQAEQDGLLNCLRNHLGRMDYPSYLKEGWQIGSGASQWEAFWATAAQKKYPRI